MANSFPKVGMEALVGSLKDEFLNGGVLSQDVWNVVMRFMDVQDVEV